MWLRMLAENKATLKFTKISIASKQPAEQVPQQYLISKYSTKNNVVLAIKSQQAKDVGSIIYKEQQPMNLAFKENNPSLRSSASINNNPLAKPRCSTEEQFQDEDSEEYPEEDRDAFNVTITERRTEEPPIRTIKRSMINRSCINTLVFNCKDLEAIPRELVQENVSNLLHIQKIDLSFNNISDVHGIPFSQMASLKELLLNDNVIAQLPFSELNQCKGLKILNVSNNRLYILPCLTRPSVIEARLNPFRLVTSELVKLSQIEFVSLDWLDYLVEGSSNSLADRWKQNTTLYSRFKANILQKIDYRNEQNSNYCDFHSYFSVRLQLAAKKPRGDTFLSALIVKAMHRNDNFFISYLKNYQNELNYANMMYSCKLLLEIALDNNSKEVIDLFKLKKKNYAEETTPEIYFESLRLACRYSHVEMFQFLVSIRAQKKKMQTKNHVSILIEELLQRYDKEKQSHKIFHSLTNMFKQFSSSKFIIRLPQQFNSKIYKSYSRAILEIYLNPELQPYYQIETEESNSSPLDFAMKSRNQQLLKEFLRQDWNLFQRNNKGIACKFIYGATQISRKLVWKKQKELIKKQWRASKETDRSIVPSNRCSRQTIENSPSFIRIDLNDSFETFNKSIGSPLSCNKIVLERPLGESQLRQTAQHKILPYLFVRSKEFVNQSWKKDYSKKIINLNCLVGALSRLQKFREESLMRRLQSWKQIIDKLSNIYHTIGEEDPLIQFQVVQTLQLIDGVREDRSPPVIKVEGQRSSIPASGFWCCRDLTDEN